MAARLLSMLVIDDVQQGAGNRANWLATEDIAPLILQRYGGGSPVPQLMSWEDHIELWRRRASLDEDPDDVAVTLRVQPRPDLMGIDCDFTADEQAPALDSAHDPRGLLYGAIQVAWMLGGTPRRPFGFAIYGRNIPGFSGDGLAVTCFGLLEAMAGSFPRYDKASDFVGWVTDRMRARSAASPGGAWRGALKGYRGRLEEACAAEHLSVDWQSFQDAADQLRLFVEGGAPPSEDLSVCWLSNFGEDRVLVRSLFADCRAPGQWLRAHIKSEDIVTWLDRIVAADRRESVLEPVALWFEGFLARTRMDSADLPDPVAPTCAGAGDRCRALALVLVWTYFWSCNLPRNATSVLTEVPGTNETRAMKAIGGTSFRPFLKRLEELGVGQWPVPIAPWVQRHARMILERHRSAIPRLPPCFRVQASEE